MPDNVELLRRVYAAWSDGDFRVVPEVYGLDLEWGWSEEFPDLERPRVEAMERSESLLQWLAPWEKWRVEAERYVTGGDEVVVLTRYRGRGRGSGVEVDSEGAHHWTFRGGRAVRLEIFSSRERALESAGLGEG